MLQTATLPIISMCREGSTDACPGEVRETKEGEAPTLDASQPLIAWSDQLSVQLQNGTRFPFSPTHAVPREFWATKGVTDRVR